MTMEFRGLHDAVQREDIEAITALLDQGVEINTKDETYSWTPLEVAAYTHRMNAARLLFERDVHLTIPQKNYDRALAFAATSKNAEFVRLFLEKGAHLLTAENLSEALSQAACFKSYETMLPLVEHGAVVTVNLLFTAAGAHVFSDPEISDRHARTVEFVLAHGIDNNEKNWDKNTALILAAKSGSLATVRLLIERGAKMNAKNSRGKTALKVAREAQHADVVSVLLEAGAKL